MHELKVGLEIHQQLNTKKLFCNCSSELTEEKGEEFIRKLIPKQSEIGEVDLASIEEAKKKNVFKYYSANTCLVEKDEEPPHTVNEDALKITLQICKILNCKIIDEVQFMRKIVIDGSNTTGFQRTALVGINGFINFNGKKIGIKSVCLEEDASRKIEEKDKLITYSLDRLGIPLIEIATDPDISNEEEAKEVALKIGQILRATKKVKRGIGTIREDLNISIKNGARVEIKGVQELNLIPKYIEEEIKRQKMLIEIKEELQKRNAFVEENIYNLSNIFKETNSHLIKNFLKKGGKVLGIKLIGFSRFLKTEKYKLGKELADYCKAFVKGIFHSDELPNYGITEKELNELINFLKLQKEDAFVIIAEKEEIARNALKEVIERGKLSLNKIPEETRNANDDGTSSYMRPLPGKARMYPETDVKPILTEDYLKNIEIPEMFEEKIKRFVKLGISVDQAKQLINDDKDEIFDILVEKYSLANVIARTLLNTIPELKEEIDIKKINEEMLDNLFFFMKKENFSREAIPEILKFVVKNNLSVEEALKKLSIGKISNEEVEKIIDEIIQSKKDFIKEKGIFATSPLMGLAMEKLKGKVDGKIVNEILRKKIELIVS